MRPNLAYFAPILGLACALGAQTVSPENPLNRSNASLSASAAASVPAADAVLTPNSVPAAGAALTPDVIAASAPITTPVPGPTPLPEPTQGQVAAQAPSSSAMPTASSTATIPMRKNSSTETGLRSEYRGYQRRLAIMEKSWDRGELSKSHTDAQTQMHRQAVADIRSKFKGGRDHKAPPLSVKEQAALEAQLRAEESAVLESQQK